MRGICGHAVHSVTVGTGAPVVMIHCMLARHEAMLPLAAAIGGRATLFDLPGHGRSAAWDGKQDYHSLVAKVAAAFCDGPTHLVGHSFGATAALRLAIERPDLVSRLTLIEPVYFAAAKGTPEHAAYARGFRPFVGAMLTGDEEKAAELFNALWGATDWRDIPVRLQRYLVDRIYLIVAGGAAIEEDPEGITTQERLANLDVPVTLIRGASTQPVISAIHKVLASRIPYATNQVVADAGHMISFTHAQSVAEIIRAAGPETG